VTLKKEHPFAKVRPPVTIIFVSSLFFRQTKPSRTTTSTIMKASSLLCCCPCLHKMLMVWTTTQADEEEESEEASSFDFKENSKAMFTDVCNASPKLVRHFSRDALVKGLKKHGCGEVYESTMYEVCREVTPAKYMARTMAILDKDRTTTSSC
jgi:hypothetical protein